MLERKEAADAQIYASKAMSEARRQWTETAIEREQTAEGAATGHAGTLQTEFDEFMSAQLEAAPPRARAMLQQSLRDYGTQLHGRAMRFEAARGVAYRTEEAQRIIDTGANVVLSDPSQFGEVIADIEEMVAGLELPADKRQALLEGGRETVAAARLGQMVDADPAALRKELNAGEWDGIIGPEQKARFLGAARAEIERRKRQAEIDRRRAEAEAQARAHEARQARFGELDLLAAQNLLSADVIQKDELLEDGQKATLIRRLGSAGARDLRIAEVGQRLAEGAAFNPYLADDRAGLNDYFDAFADRRIAQAEAEEDGEAPSRADMAAGFALQTGVAVDALVADTRQAIASGDPMRAAESLARAEAIRREHPSIWRAASGGAGIEKATARFTAARRVGYGGTDAVAYAIRDNSLIEQEAVRSARRRFDGKATDDNPEITQDQLRSAIRQRYAAWDRPEVAAEDNLALMGDAQRIYQIEFERANGVAEVAQEATLEMIGRTWGPTTVGGEWQLMKHPPEMVYPAVGGSHDYIAEQIEADLREAGVNWDDGSVMLMTTARTIEELEAGRAPPYRLMYEDDDTGLMETLGEGWEFVADPEAARAILGDEVNWANAETRERRKLAQAAREEALRRREAVSLWPDQETAARWRRVGPPLAD